MKNLIKKKRTSIRPDSRTANALSDDSEEHTDAGTFDETLDVNKRPSTTSIVNEVIDNKN
jgi:hypothetical protein